MPIQIIDAYEFAIGAAVRALACDHRGLLGAVRVTIAMPDGEAPARRISLAQASAAQHGVQVTILPTTGGVTVQFNRAPRTCRRHRPFAARVRHKAA